MFTHALFPSRLFPPRLFPPVGTSAVGSGGGLFPHRLFPASLFPGRMFCPVASSPTAPTDFRRALVSSLLASSDLSAIVGTQVYPLRVPEGTTTPAILYQVLKLPRQHTLDGPVGLAEASVRLAAGSRLFAQTDAAATVLRNLYDGFNGSLAGGVEVEEVVLKDEQDLYDPPVDASDRGTFWTVLTFTFRVQESVVL